jgi:hypothetical protein
MASNSEVEFRALSEAMLDASWDLISILSYARAPDEFA